MGLTKQEKDWIKNEIECTVSSYRVDDNRETFSFDKKIFSVGDYHEQKIAILEKLYSKLS